MSGVRGMVLRLSLADLRHEWILSLCLVMAVGAVLSPLLILFGLKFGTIEIMRERLIEDPRNREIRPMISRSFERDWFEGMASRPDVDFVVPFTRQISAQVDARVRDGDGHLALDILPTAEGDPLLTQNGAPVPGEGECVLSASAAEALGAGPGAELEVTAKRLRGSQYEKATARLRVAGVARMRATVLNSLYVPLPFLEAVERFKDGQAVPEYGWPGEQALAYPVFDGLAVVLDEPLSRVDEFRLVNNTGFSQKERLDPATLEKRLGWSFAPRTPDAPGRLVPDVSASDVSVPDVSRLDGLQPDANASVPEKHISAVRADGSDAEANGTAVDADSMPTEAGSADANLSPEEGPARSGPGRESLPSVYLASSKRKPVDEESLLAVKYALRGRNPVLLPWVRELRAELVVLPPAGEVSPGAGEGGDGPQDGVTGETDRTVLAELRLDAFSLAPEDAARLRPSVLPGWGVAGGSTPSASWRRIALPEALHLPLSEGDAKAGGNPSGPGNVNAGTPDLSVPDGLRLGLRVTREDGSRLEFPVAVDPVRVPGEGRALVPARLAGVLNLFGERNVAFDPITGEFDLARRGYAGFRLYAATIDDVDGLRRELEAQGVTVSTEAERIRDVMELDGYLTLIFLLIAGVALAGGTASLTASLYASVERKRRDLSVLRLLGLSGPALFRFPVYQGALIAAMGFGVAFAFFEAMAVVINTLFSEHLQAEESLCRLEPWHLGAALAGTVLVAVVAGSVAAWRVTRIEPAEALRDE